MLATVTVRYSVEREYQIHPPQDVILRMSGDAARNWLDEQFEALECEPANPVGKILLLDQLLDIARYGGEAHFRAADAWAHSYAAAALAVRRTPTVLVDIGAWSVS